MRLAFLGFLFLVLAAPVQAQVPMQMTMPCYPHDAVTKLIGDKYKEVRRSYGVSGHNLTELYLSPTGSWTLLTTAPAGMTCILASGEGWENVPAIGLGHPT